MSSQLSPGPVSQQYGVTTKPLFKSETHLAALGTCVEYVLHATSEWLSHPVPLHKGSAEDRMQQLFSQSLVELCHILAVLKTFIYLCYISIPPLATQRQPQGGLQHFKKTP